VWLYDTSIWVEWLVGTHLGKSFNAKFASIETSLIPTLVQFELQKWCLRERNEAEAERLLALTMTGVVVPLDTATAIHAAMLAKRHSLHSTDALIYATATLADATLATCDAHFQGLPGVQYFTK
jgi:predicted nucleic acid-binding protein